MNTPGVHYSNKQLLQRRSAVSYLIFSGASPIKARTWIYAPTLQKLVKNWSAIRAKFCSGITFPNQVANSEMFYFALFFTNGNYSTLRSELFKSQGRLFIKKAQETPWFALLTRPGAVIPDYNRKKGKKHRSISMSVEQKSTQLLNYLRKRFSCG
jgi:hypothetical protein